MIESRNFVLFSLLVFGSTLACGSDKGKEGDTPNDSHYNVGNTGGMGTGLDQALQPDGTLLLKGTIRDFHSTFPDMEPCSNNSSKTCNSERNEQRPACVATGQCIVADTLGADGTPHYAGPARGTLTTSGPAKFAHWFNNTSSNMSSELQLTLEPTDTGVYKYRNMAFFPIDGLLFGNEGQDGQGVSRNFNFTTEWHLMFTYQPGQTFTFRGDDDLWVYVDGKLVIDLGGIHEGHDATLELDTLGLAAGTDHSFDIFYCERHVIASEIEIETSIQFSGSVVVN